MPNEEDVKTNAFRKAQNEFALEMSIARSTPGYIPLDMGYVQREVDRAVSEYRASKRCPTPAENRKYVQSLRMPWEER